MLFCGDHMHISMPAAVRNRPPPTGEVGYPRFCGMECGTVLRGDRKTADILRYLNCTGGQGGIRTRSSASTGKMWCSQERCLLAAHRQVLQAPPSLACDPPRGIHQPACYSNSVSPTCRTGRGRPSPMEQGPMGRGRRITGSAPPVRSNISISTGWTTSPAIARRPERARACASPVGPDGDRLLARRATPSRLPPVVGARLYRLATNRNMMT